MGRAGDTLGRRLGVWLGQGQEKGPMLILEHFSFYFLAFYFLPFSIS
jgi:hypothetical protein